MADSNVGCLSFLVLLALPAPARMCLRSETSVFAGDDCLASANPAEGPHYSDDDSDE